MPVDLVWASPYTWTMEHWGVITVKPNDLRFDADTDISYGRLYNAHVIIHEMIHQVSPMLAPNMLQYGCSDFLLRAHLFDIGLSTT